MGSSACKAIGEVGSERESELSKKRRGIHPTVKREGSAVKEKNGLFRRARTWNRAKG